MIKVCPSCSNVDVFELEALVGFQNIEEMCLGLCGTNFEKSIAYVNGQWIETDDEAEFFKQAKKILEI